LDVTRLGEEHSHIGLSLKEAWQTIETGFHPRYLLDDNIDRIASGVTSVLTLILLSLFHSIFNIEFRPLHLDHPAFGGPFQTFMTGRSKRTSVDN
jgi:hypothetical protein